MNIYEIIFLCVVALVFIVYIIDRCTGRKLTLAIIQWQPALTALTALCGAIAGILPSSHFSIAAAVLKAASEATQRAEKLYQIGELPKEERNAYAQKLIADTLREAGINVTDQIQTIIDGCIAVVCLLMPHEAKPATTN